MISYVDPLLRLLLLHLLHLLLAFLCSRFCSGIALLPHHLIAVYIRDLWRHAFSHFSVSICPMKHHKSNKQTGAQLFCVLIKTIIYNNNLSIDFHMQLILVK